MRIYCMSDIHGCLAEFEEALNQITEHLCKSVKNYVYWNFPTIRKIVLTKKNKYV